MPPSVHRASSCQHARHEKARQCIETTEGTDPSDGGTAMAYTLLLNRCAIIRRGQEKTKLSFIHPEQWTLSNAPIASTCARETGYNRAAQVLCAGADTPIGVIDLPMIRESVSVLLEKSRLLPGANEAPRPERLPPSRSIQRKRTSARQKGWAGPSLFFAWGTTANDASKKEKKKKKARFLLTR